MYIYPIKDFYFIGNQAQIRHVLKFVNQPERIRQLSCDFRSPSLISIFYFFRIIFLPNSLKIDLSGNFWTPLYFFSSYQNIIFQHHPWWNISTKRIKLFFSWLNFKVMIIFKPRILVLWKWIFDNIKDNHNYSPEEKRLFFWITHPFLIDKKLITFRLTRNKVFPKIFWFFGKQNLFYKWKNDYKIIINTLKENFIPIIESVSGNLSLNDYYSNMGAVEYVVIPYLQNYSFSCSGVFIDAIINLKPIICIKSPMSDYFFNQYGDLWFVCQDSYDLTNRIISISKLSYFERNKIYNAFIKNIEIAKKAITSLDLVGFEYHTNLIDYEP